LRPEAREGGREGREGERGECELVHLVMKSLRAYQRLLSLKEKRGREGGREGGREEGKRYYTWRSSSRP